MGVASDLDGATRLAVILDRHLGMNGVLNAWPAGIDERLIDSVRRMESPLTARIEPILQDQLARAKSIVESHRTSLELRQMQPSGIYENVDEYSEQVARIGGEDYDYGLMEHGIWHHNEDGNEVPIPEDAKTVLRLCFGKLLIVSKGSIWNHTNNNWNGKHNVMTADEIGSLIERSLQ